MIAWWSTRITQVGNFQTTDWPFGVGETKLSRDVEGQIGRPLPLPQVVDKPLRSVLDIVRPRLRQSLGDYEARGAAIFRRPRLGTGRNIHRPWQKNPKRLHSSRLVDFDVQLFRRRSLFWFKVSRHDPACKEKTSEQEFLARFLFKETWLLKNDK